ncbi:MAG TPA: hypothetical protein VF128_11190, partial [Gemmatimonadaceae bacterium]
MRRPGTLRLSLLSVLGVAAAMSAAAPVQNPSSRPVRVLLASVPSEVAIGQSGRWKLVDDGRRVVATSESSDRWSVMRDGRRLRVIHADAPATPWITGSLSLELESGEVTWQQKSYRGVLTFVATDSAL